MYISVSTWQSVSSFSYCSFVRVYLVIIVKINRSAAGLKEWCGIAPLLSDLVLVKRLSYQMNKCALARRRVECFACTIVVLTFHCFKCMFGVGKSRACKCESQSTCYVIEEVFSVDTSYKKNLIFFQKYIIFDSANILIRHLLSNNMQSIFQQYLNNWNEKSSYHSESRTITVSHRTKWCVQRGGNASAVRI